MPNNYNMALILRYPWNYNEWTCIGVFFISSILNHKFINCMLEPVLKYSEMFCRIYWELN